MGFKIYKPPIDNEILIIIKNMTIPHLPNLRCCNENDIHEESLVMLTSVEYNPGVLVM